RRMLHIYETHPDIKQIGLGDCYVNLGNVYRSRGKFADAKQMYQRGLAIYDRYFGDDKPYKASVLNNLCSVSIHLNAMEDAEKYAKEALDARRRHLGNDHPDLVPALNNLGEVYRHQKRCQEAKDAFEEAIKICESRLDKDNDRIASPLTNLAAVLCATDE